MLDEAERGSRDALWGLIKAITAGTLAGAIVPVLMLGMATLAFSSSTSDYKTGLSFVLVGFLIPLALVSGSALLIGVPVTLLLKLGRLESQAAYMMVGGLAGILVPGLVLAVAESDPHMFYAGLAPGVLGAFSGAITGRAWWRAYRKEAVRRAEKAS